MAEENAVVEYKVDLEDAEDAEKVEIQSPARNRYKDTALASTTEKKGMLPIMFERASKSWWNPRFDSDTLESQHQNLSFGQTRKRFQYALIYVIVSCIAFAVFFGCMQLNNWVQFVAGSIILLAIAVLILGFSFTRLYKRLVLPTSVVLSLLLCLFCLLSFIYEDPDLSAVGTFIGTIEILLLMYTLIPLPLYLCFTMGVCYSVVYELMSGFLTTMQNPHYIVGRALLHVAIHVIGLHIFITAQVRKRSTFLKVGQSVMSRKDLDIEKTLKQKMIHSLMPPVVAEEIMKTKKEKSTDCDSA